MDHFQSFENNNLPEGNPITLEQNKIQLGQLSKSSRRAWAQQEDEQLRQAIKLHGTNWLVVASALTNRNPSQCAQRWKRIKPNNLFSKRQSWTQKEDNLLLTLVELHNKNWVQIAKKIPNRTSKQVRERFINNLNPEINQEPFTDAEDKMIIDGFKSFGSQWCKISKLLQGRPENVIKNRFYSYLRKQYLKIDNPYYVIPKQNQDISHSIISNQRCKQSKKKKSNKKFSQQIENIEDNNEQKRIKKQCINKHNNISKKSYKKIDKRFSQASKVEQYQEYNSDHKNQRITRGFLNESFEIVKEEEQQENYYYHPILHQDNFEQLPANYYSSSCTLNAVQPYEQYIATHLSLEHLIFHHML
ncbi:unnamed protein product (macronuclear) [Paramecium tetraurelia]|uniref:Uncharacterized protein n=1 Tax=Paramecium tetraurelia TaxID=5888 RepID=A0DQV1_PARTE|nr:uncharacterized protein GSPATT00002818001 [Paramecium tetraurelia]CAK85418.1 unnamed protein product [Paramecium tetraurelia]|eukprot:XP_001452815.1 hypothetical protein (macronuclear) [Paramecium tetraurelia strain d4-2]